MPRQFYDVELSFVISIVNPFEIDVWGCGPITRELVKQSNSIMEYWNPDDDNQIWSVEQHAGRIKFLSEQSCLDPICIDVSYHTKSILDGHHRLSAAIFLNKKSILCDIKGQLSVVENFILKDQK